MTCRYSGIDWRDVLYTSVCDTPGGVEDAASFLCRRRGKQRMTGESLRLKLRSVGDARISAEIFELLVEWMLEKRQPQALDAVHAFNERFGLIATARETDTEPVASLPNQMMKIAHDTGLLAETVIEALADDRIEQHEADAIAEQARELQRKAETLAQAALSVAKHRGTA